MLSHHSPHRLGLVITGALLALFLVAPSSAQHGVAGFQKISDTDGNFEGDLDDGDEFCVTAGIGDLDGDGVPDLAVGANKDDDGGSNRGAVWILFLNTDGSVKAHQKISELDGRFAGHLDNGDNFGWSIESMGDFDGDGPGHHSIAVGAPRDDDGILDTGAIWVLHLDIDGTVVSNQKISALEGGFGGGIEGGDRFGQYMAFLGDVDDDGVGDLAVGSPFDDDGGEHRGAVYILFLNDDATVRDFQKISDTEGGFQGELRNEDRFGVSVACPGDLDGDGVPDLSIGANGVDDFRGVTWILLLNANGTVKSEQMIGQDTGGFTGILDPGDNFGWSQTGMGDLDSNGVSDLAISASGDDDGGNNRGALWLLYLNADGTVSSHQKISDIEGGLFQGQLDDIDWFGDGPDVIGDLNGDGLLEFAVGNWGDDDGGSNKGAVFILTLDLLTGVDDSIAATPAPRHRLVACAPNPFNPRTTIHFELASRSPAGICIFDISGRLVRELELGVLNAGPHAVHWDGLDARGRPAPGGTYLVRLDTPGSHDAIRVSLVK